ncbi:MAG: DUF6142 family protein [bacterium]|nr:DUF6142 family protein [bacterium]
MKYKKRKGGYMFTDKKHSIEGIFAVVVGIAILATILVLSYQSSLSGGNGPILYGIVSFFAMVLSFGAFVVSVMSLRDKEVFRGFPIFGSILNGLLFIILFLIYIVGISI